MRIKVALGIWLLGITLAWMAVAPPDLGLSPLVDAQGAAMGWWKLRQHAIYLSGLWSISLMAMIMLLALRPVAVTRVDVGALGEGSGRKGCESGEAEDDLLHGILLLDGLTSI